MVAGRELDLTGQEFDLLAFLAREPGTVCRREDIIAAVWDENWWGSTKTLDVHVASFVRSSVILAGSRRWARRLPVERTAVTRRLLASYLTITLLVLAVLVLPLGFTFANHESDVLLAGIERDAHAVAASVEENLEAGTAPQIDALLKQYATDGGRIVVVDTRGSSVADSDAIGGAPRDFSTRPEIQAALGGPGHPASGGRTPCTAS